jgi:beta-lactamase superfamily II metal-dependent hydrolase
MNRLDVRKIIPLLLLGVMALWMPAVLQAQAAQTLEIHYINVQQGQSTLIIGPDGTTILYDGGNEFKGTNEVVPYLQSIGITTAQTLDYIITSHLHTDHYRGLTEVMNYGYDALNVYDNGSTNYNTFVQDFYNAAAATTAGGVTAMTLGQTISLGNGATATCVAVNGSVQGVGAIQGGQDNENDRSIVLLVQYGDFDFVVTGDLGGGIDDQACTGRSTSQVNMESPLVKALMPAGANPKLSAYGAEVIHVGHHGSESSTNIDYMNILSPAVACISVGPGQGTDWYHPRIDVVENVLLAGVACVTAPAALVLQTEEGYPTGVKTSFAGYNVGDIVITTDGVSTYTISATGAVSQGPDERIAAGLPVTLTFEEVSAVDTTPIIYDVHDENTSRTTADIVWSTNESSNSVVKYGTVSGTYTTTVTDNSMVVNHRISLTGLTQFTTYYYVVESTDATYNTTTSEEHMFMSVNPEDIKVVFSEVFYDTPGTDSLEEWVELYNNSPVTVDIGGWKIIDNNGSGTSYTIPVGESVAPGTYYTVAVDQVGFETLYGYLPDQYGSLPGMNNTGDALVLKNKSGVIKDAVAFEGGYNANLPAGWGSTTEPAAGTGYTIVRSDPTVDTDTYADWSTDGSNGFPQTQGMNDPDNMNVVFSEVFYDTPGDDTQEEWIELYNNSPMSVDLENWTITDNNGTGSTYTFPQGCTIAAHSYYTVAVNSTGFTNLYGYAADKYGSIPALNNTGDALILKNNQGTQKDTVAWEGGAAAGVPTSWGSITVPVASTGNSIVRTDVTTDTDTYSDWSTLANNGFPQTQALSYLVVFSEVYYDTSGDDAVEEWIEIYNNSPVTVDIGGWKITDNNGAGATFTIPDGETISPGAYFTIAADSTGFNNLYGYDADLYGALPALNNTGDALVLKDSHDNQIDAVAWEGGATGGIPTGWGSTSAPSASTGSTIVRTSVTTDTDTYVDWTTAANDGNPQTQGGGDVKVVFSEIFYDTPGTDSVEEWIELYNNSSVTIDISGWTITDNNGAGATFTIPQGNSIAPGAYFTIAIDSTGFYALYGYNANLYGGIPSLNNTGDALILKDGNGNTKDTVAWEGGSTGGIPTGWGSTTAPSAATGYTIVRSSVTTDNDTYTDWSTAANNGNPQIQ